MSRHSKGGGHILSSQGVCRLAGKPEMWRNIDLKTLEEYRPQCPLLHKSGLCGMTPGEVAVSRVMSDPAV